MIPELASFDGPCDLVRRGLPIPEAPGAYVVASGACISHIGTSGHLRRRVRSLAALGTHRGSAEVLCAAFCTGEAPRVGWLPTISVAAARALEADLKHRLGEPPSPRSDFASCRNGAAICAALVAAARPETWEAGYVEAVFAIGERLNLLFQPRFAPVWERVGVPTGPWSP